MLLATYRIQLHAQFGFTELTRALPYLASLGVTHLYLSPVFHSRAGSTHGYDVIDHGRIDPDLGDRQGFEAMVAAARQAGLGVVLDIVPNHMAVLGVENALWRDVLENGPASRFAGYFDIDWSPARQTMRNRLLVPILGAPQGEVIERGEIRLVFRAEAGTFHVKYFDHMLPVEPRSYPYILRAAERHPRRAHLEEDAAQELASLLDLFAALPPPVAADPQVLQVRDRDRQVNQRRLARLCQREPGILRLIEAALERINPPSPDPELLEDLLRAQPYRLAYWRVSGEEINYRRFFDVNELAAVRMEDPEVFHRSHALLRELWHARLIDGVRVDHADGLYDPAEYFRRLRDVLTPEADQHRPWMVVEKILGLGERLPTDWCVDGTTGYEFGALVTGWLSHGSGIAELDRIWRRQVGGARPYGEIVYQSKKQVMQTSLAAEISNLAARLDRLAQRHRNTTDFTLFDLRAAIVEVIACFPVYRTYITPGHMSGEDVQNVRRAIGSAYSRKHSAHRALEFLERVLLGELEGDPQRAAAAVEFTQKFQQVTSPVMAKGVEDTSFYRFARYLPMNEVGADPDAGAVSTELLHRANEERARDWPCAMLSTSTHDSKRSEDARWRLCVLSEMAQEWSLSLGRWRRLKRNRPVAGAPEVVQEYILLQSLLGIWPADTSSASADQDSLRARLGEYAIKAAREAKEDTSWLEPDEQAEARLQELVATLLPEQGASGFERYFRAVIDPVAFFGMLNSLSAVTLKLTAPGIPDLYQGSERPVLSLVDPDNRRPVDLAAHAQQLDAIDALLEQSPEQAVAALLGHWQDGRIKLLVTSRLLRLRGQLPAVFQGEYLALATRGARSDHVCAFARLSGDQAVISVVARWTATLAQGALQAPLGEAAWEDTAVLLPAKIPVGRYRDVLTGRVHQVIAAGEATQLEAAALFAQLPCCVLARIEGDA